MWRFTIGLASGLYIGTHYDCKPLLANAQEFWDKYFPEKKGD